MKKNKFVAGIKKTIVFSALSVFSLLFLFAAAGFFRDAKFGNAQVALFFPASCLGGWKNTENARGAPEIFPGGEDEYNDSNSASVSNAVAEIFCGGFRGEVPDDVLQKRVLLKFSWSIQKTERKSERAQVKSVEPAETVEPSETDEAAETNEGAVEEVEEAVNDDADYSEEESEETEDAVATEEESLATDEDETEAEADIETEENLEEVILNLILPKVYAEENTENQAVEDNEIVANETDADESDEPGADEESEPGPSETPSDALVEVLYTLDGDNWQSLGFVSRIKNSVSFEMPPDIFTSISDLERVQIAVRSVSSLGHAPKIYLDSLWLEVEYDYSADVMDREMLAGIGSAASELFENIAQEASSIFSSSNYEFSFSRSPLGASITSPIVIDFSTDDITNICGSPPDFPEARYWWIFVNSLDENGGNCGGGGFCSETLEADTPSAKVAISLPPRADYYVIGTFCSDNTDDPNDPRGNFWSPNTAPQLEGGHEAPFNPIFEVLDESVLEASDEQTSQ